MSPARVETAEGLVQDDQADVRPRERAAEPYALSLSARGQAATLAQSRLEPVGQSFEHLLELRGRDHLAQA